MPKKETEKKNRKTRASHAARKRRTKKVKAEKPAKAGRRTDRNGLLSNKEKWLGGFDYVVLGMVILLSVFGIAMVFSASYYSTVTSSDDPLYYLKRQTIWVVTGLVILFVVANIDYHFYNRIANLLITVSIALLILVLLIGNTANGATRWINIFGIPFTPSELSKLIVIIFTSVYLASDPEAIRTWRGILVLTAVWGAHFLLIAKQPNLSTAIVIVAIMIGIMIAAGVTWGYIAFLGVGAVAGTFVILTFMKDSHWYSRLTNWIDPFADSQGEGYQVSQSIIALGNGGLKGLGFGKSISKNLYLPEPQNDFILAVIGEELGYWGFLLLMAAYMFLLFRLVMIALRASDSLGFYLATGVAVMLGLQVIINVAVVTASMPATGITLPFISYGGTSMWSFMAAMGIALNVSRKKGTKPARSKR